MYIYFALTGQSPCMITISGALPPLSIEKAADKFHARLRGGVSESS